MIRAFLLLGLLALLPWWVSWGLERLGVRIPIAAQFAAWVKAPPEDGPPGLPPDWREDRYLARNPDVAAAVRKGAVSSGYAHYVAFGRAEGRVGGFDLPAPAAVPTAPPPAEPPTAPPPPPAAPPPPPIAVPSSAPPLPPPPPPEPVVAAAPVSVPVPPVKPPVPVPLSSPPPRSIASPPVGPTAGPAIVQVSGIRVGVHQDFTRIVLDVDAPLRLERPPAVPARSVGVDLPSAVWRIARQGQLIARTLAYRVEDAGSGASRLTLDAETPIQVKSLFLLPPERERRHRVVLDLVRADTGGPLPAKR